MDPLHFKMEDLRTARNLIFQNYYMASLDLSDAFYLIPISKTCRKFLRFEFLGTLYQITCLPFGLCTSPFIFTKVMKPVMALLRSQQLTSVIYLGDILCIEDSFDKCYQNVEKTIALLKSLGFLLNTNKSNVQP